MSGISHIVTEANTITVEEHVCSSYSKLNVRDDLEKLNHKHQPGLPGTLKYTTYNMTNMRASSLFSE